MFVYLPQGRNFTYLEDPGFLPRTKNTSKNTATFQLLNVRDAKLLYRDPIPIVHGFLKLMDLSLAAHGLGGYGGVTTVPYHMGNGC